MKCFICGNELGNNRYCRMCGADNGVVGNNLEEKQHNTQQSTDNYTTSDFIYGGNSDYAYENANILKNIQSDSNEMNTQAFPEDTTVLIDDIMTGMPNSNISENKNENSKEKKDNIDYSNA